MQATPTQKKDFANIRRKIIEPAIKELCEKMAGKLNTKPSKQGEKVTGLHFTFERDKQENLF